MVVSLVGPVRYGVIYLNGESCSGRSLGSCPKRRKRAWLCGEGDFRQTERELSPSFKFYSVEKGKLMIGKTEIRTTDRLLRRRKGSVIDINKAKWQVVEVD